MKTRCYMAILTVCFLLFGSPAIASATPTDWLKSLDNKLKPLLKDSKQNNQKIIQILGQMMDFDTLCKESLGNHWKDRTAAEQKDFSDTLRALIEKNVVERLADTAKKNPDAVVYQDEKVRGDKATVTTVVRDGTGPRAAEIELVYKLEKSGNSWVVVDMETDGVSLVSNYRSQFNSIISKDGWDKMMKMMKDKLAE